MIQRDRLFGLTRLNGFYFWKLGVLPVFDCAFVWSLWRNSGLPRFVHELHSARPRHVVVSGFRASVLYRPRLAVPVT